MTGLRMAPLGVVLSCVSALAGDWSPRRAAEYLDAREQAWVEWKPSNIGNGNCVSCHTNVPYLMARPALRRALGEPSPTPYEKGLIEGLRARLDGRGMFPGFKQEPLATQGASIEAVFAALFVGSPRAYEKMWGLQKDGAWPWFDFKSDPYETADSAFFGSALAAYAIGSAPAESRDAEKTRQLIRYLEGAQGSQPLHNRLWLLWAATKLPEAAPAEVRKQIVTAALAKQCEDGGWTMQALGPFAPHETAPAATGSSAYATALAAFTLQAGGVARSDARMARALAWLRSHQDATGAWKAVSMNKAHPAGSMQVEFMSDAATAFAVMALLGGGEQEAAAVEYPRDYREWVHVKSMLIPVDGGIHHIYANPQAREGYRSGTFPNGSVIAYEVLQWREANGVTVEGPRQRVDVMAKNGEWRFERFKDGAPVSTAEARAQCAACHQKMQTSDLVIGKLRKD